MLQLYKIEKQELENSLNHSATIPTEGIPGSLSLCEVKDNAILYRVKDLVLRVIGVKSKRSAVAAAG